MKGEKVLIFSGERNEFLLKHFKGIMFLGIQDFKVMIFTGGFHKPDLRLIEIEIADKFIWKEK